METWELERMSLGLNLQTGWNPAARYTLEACQNLRLNAQGNLVTRPGCRLVFTFPLTGTINRLLVTDVDGVKTFLTSEVYAVVDATRYVMSWAVMSGEVLAPSPGPYMANYASYERSSGVPFVPLSNQGWQFVAYHNRVYALSGTPQSLDVETGNKTSGGMFRWRWNHLATPAPRLQDWGIDSLADIRLQNPALSAPTIAKISAVPPVSPDIRPLTDAAGRDLEFEVGDRWERRSILRSERRKATQPSDTASSVGAAEGLRQGRYFYYLTYMRSDTLAESDFYRLEMEITALDVTPTVVVPPTPPTNFIRIASIPTHPDVSVDKVRIYRNVGPTEPQMRIIAELPNGTASYEDGGVDAAFDEPYGGSTPPPSSVHVAVHNQRLFVVALTSAGAVLYWSEEGEPENFQVATDWIVLENQPASQPMGMASLGQQSNLESYASGMLVFDRTNTYGVYGDPPTERRRLSSIVGCQAERSIAVYASTVVWLGANGVYVSDGGEPRRISVPVDPILQAVPGDTLRSAAGAVFNNRYHLAFTDETGDRRVLVCDFLHRDQQGNFIWTEDDYPFSILTLSVYTGTDGKERLYAGTSTGEVFELEVGDRDENIAGATQNIAVTFTLNPNWFGNKSQRKQMRIVHLGVQSPAALTLATDVDDRGYVATYPLAGANPLLLDGTWILDGSRNYINEESQRRVRVPLNDRHQGSNLRLTITGTNDVSIGSLAVQFQRKTLH